MIDPNNNNNSMPKHDFTCNTVHETETQCKLSSSNTTEYDEQYDCARKDFEDVVKKYYLALAVAGGAHGRQGGVDDDVTYS